MLYSPVSGISSLMGNNNKGVPTEEKHLRGYPHFVLVLQVKHRIRLKQGVCRVLCTKQMSDKSQLKTSQPVWVSPDVPERLAANAVLWCQVLLLFLYRFCMTSCHKSIICIVTLNLFELFNVTSTWSLVMLWSKPKLVLPKYPCGHHSGGCALQAAPCHSAFLKH